MATVIAPPTEENLRRAVELLTAGDLVAIPTETVYGLAANALSSAAVRKIFEAKGRPPTNPLIVHLASADRLPDAIRWPPPDSIRRQLEVAASFWPGPLTVIGPRGDAIPDAVTAGHDTVAVRVPDHPVAARLLAACPFPLAAPSANRSNYVSPTRARHVAEGLGEAVAMVLDGGDCARGIESTIIALEQPVPRLLRPGAVSLETLTRRFGQPLRARSRAETGGGKLEAPGMMRRHYSPRTPVVILGESGGTEYPAATGRLAFAPLSDEEASRFAVVETLSRSGDLEEVAANLFAALRSLDARRLDLIVSDACRETGIGRAIMDRLRRAAAKSGEA